MNVTDRQAGELRSVSAFLELQAEKTRPTFTDETRPKFDHHVTFAMKREINSLASTVSQLGLGLASALAMLD